MLTLLGLQSRFENNWGQITRNVTALSPKRDWSSKGVNPFRTAVPLWGQTIQISSSLSPKRGCGPKGVKRTGRIRMCYIIMASAKCNLPHVIVTSAVYTTETTYYTHEHSRIYLFNNTKNRNIKRNDDIETGNPTYK